jgi:hypothetical protein
MFELVNKTQFLATLLPTMDADGGEAAMVIIKGTYTLGTNAQVTRAANQAPLVAEDQYHGEPGQSSLRYASEVVPEKRGTDVVLIGSACVQVGETTQMDVTLECGPVKKTVRIIGDRTWNKSMLSASPSKPKPFAVMPLVYERAFGGVDMTHKKESHWAQEGRNPVGRGFIANTGREDFATVLLPNLEDPKALIAKTQDRPAPAGFGFIGPSWEPRKKYAGTYDDAWQNSRCPLLPADFDARFFNAAHPDLISKEFLLGGEPVRITNACKATPLLSFRLPALAVRATFYIDGKVTEQACNLDTVIVEPDERRLLLTWRTKIRCHRKIKYVTGARVTATEQNV